MSFKSKAYLSLVVGCGLASLAVHLPQFRTTDYFRFATYLGIALLASGMKVKLPQITGTMSVLFLFLLIGILELSLPEILVIAVAATFVQSFWRAGKTPKPVHLAFNIASLVIAVEAAHFVFNAPFLLEKQVPVPWRLAAAAFTFFVGNTMTVAVIVALTEGKPILQTWRGYYFWSFPHYIIGASIAGLFSYLTRLVGWQTSIFMLPVIFMIYRSYRLYLDRLEQERLHAEEQKTSATRLNSVLESTTDCVFAIDDAARIVYANTRARSRLFGDSEPVSMLVWEKFPQLAVAGFRDRVNQAIAEGTAVHLEEFFPELKGWFEVHAYPSQEGVAFYLKEVTEERELSEQLRQAHKMEAVGRLAGGVAHDFNNLLTIILGYVQVAAHLLEKGHPARSSLGEVQKAGERAAALTQRLLAFSRKQVVQLETVDPNVIIAGMEGMLIRLIETYGFRWCSIPPSVRFAQTTTSSNRW
jgi:signal transduction histidine kinase